MSEIEISRRYAQALFDLAQEENALYPVYVSLQEIGILLKENSEFKVFIYNPLLSLNERNHIFKQVFENKIPKLLYKFLFFINDKNRLDILGDICNSFDALYLEKNNQMKASLETAYTLDDSQKKSLQEKLGHSFHKEIVLNHEIKTDLIGGFRLSAAGKLYDSSIKSQLEQFRQKVLA